MAISNGCKFIGRLTRDPELRFIPNSGKAVVNFAIAVADDFDYKNKDKTFFKECVGWGKQAEYIANNTTKGKLIAVEGKMYTDKWEDKNGNKRSTDKLLIENVKILEWKDSGSNQNYNNDSHGYENQDNSNQRASTAPGHTAAQNAIDGQDQQSNNQGQDNMSGFQAIEGDDDIPFKQ